MPSTSTNAAGREKMSVDGKVIYCGAGFCSVLGLVLVVVGAVVYLNNASDGEHTCTCPEGASGDECCTELHSLCDECWCTHFEESEGYCSPYEDTGSHGGAGLSIAVAGLVVCIISAIMLLSMKACKNWSEKNLHEKRPPIANNSIV